MAPRKQKADVTEEFEEALVKGKSEEYILRLYIAGNNARSLAAVENVKKICEEHLKGRYQLEIVDIYQNGTRNQDDLILAAPTLIRQLPLPLRRIIGDMTMKEKVLVGLDLLPRKG